MPQFCTFPRANRLTDELLHPSVSCFFSPRAAPTSSALPGPTQLQHLLFPQPPPNPQDKWFLKGCQSQLFPVQPADAKEREIHARGSRVLPRFNLQTRKMEPLAKHSGWCSCGMRDCRKPSGFSCLSVFSWSSDRDEWHEHMTVFLKSQSRYNEEHRVSLEKKNALHPMHSCK